MPAGREAGAAWQRTGAGSGFFCRFFAGKDSLDRIHDLCPLAFLRRLGRGEILAVFFPVVVDPVFNRLLTVRPFSRLLFFPVRARSSCLRQCPDRVAFMLRRALPSFSLSCIGLSGYGRYSVFPPGQWFFSVFRPLDVTRFFGLSRFTGRMGPLGVSWLFRAPLPFCRSWACLALARCSQWRQRQGVGPRSASVRCPRKCQVS